MRIYFHKHKPREHSKFSYNGTPNLESELGEEPLVLTGLVFVLKDLANVLLGDLVVLRFLGVSYDRQIDIDVVTSRHNVSQIHLFQEGLDARAFSDHTTRHTLGDLKTKDNKYFFLKLVVKKKATFPKRNNKLGTKYN